MKGFPVHMKESEDQPKTNRKQRRAQAAVERKRSRKLTKQFEKAAKVAYERTQAMRTEEAAKEYEFG